MRYYEDAYTRRIRKEAQEKERERARKEIEEVREEIREEERKEGREEGRKEGREEGRKEGREEGIAELQEKQRALAKRLTEDNRSSEIPLLITDPNFFNEQFAAYFPNGLSGPSK